VAESSADHDAVHGGRRERSVVSGLAAGAGGLQEVAALKLRGNVVPLPGLDLVVQNFSAQPSLARIDDGERLTVQLKPDAGVHVGGLHNVRMACQRRRQKAKREPNSLLGLRMIAGEL